MAQLLNAVTCKLPFLISQSSGQVLLNVRATHTHTHTHTPLSPQVLNAVTRKLPFFVSQSEADAEPPREELRLKHRVLDLR